MAMEHVKTKQFASIQYLRAFAALLVVFHHVRRPHAGLYDPLRHFQVGQAGVDLFFVISGFIMYSAARDERPQQFLKRRIVRVVPMYWLATVLFAAARTLEHSGALTSALGYEVLQSLLFIPHYSTEFPTHVWPYLVPGWTLNLEMFFYAVFALGLVVRRPLLVVVATMVPLVILGGVFRSPEAIWATYTKPLLIEFVGGVLIARLTRGDVSARWAILLPIGVMGVAASALVDVHRLFAWGVPGMMMVLGAVVLERHGKLPQVPWLGRLGDASYSIYLFQFFAIEPILTLVTKLHLPAMPAFLLAMVLGISGSVALGLLAHHVLERPILRWLSRSRRKAYVGMEDTKASA
jgi:exopolysaccharide production protein ExoZ